MANFQVRDIELAPRGQVHIDWVAKWMKVLNQLREQYMMDGSFRGKRVALCIHLEAKTAYLALTIQQLGAEVWVTSSNPLSTKDDVAAALARHGVHVFAEHDADDETYNNFVRAIVEHQPHVIVDDGGDVCHFIHQNPAFGQSLLGFCEETTTGVARLREMARANELRYPAIAINDARSKYLFDNRYGTGQSTWTAIMHLTNRNVAGKTVVVIGYGWVGRGVALRAKGLGAEVVVTEIDPWKALEAKMDGMRVMPIAEAAQIGDYVITATGARDVLRAEHFSTMKDGACLANAGHFDYEIETRALRDMAQSARIVRDNIEEFALRNRSRLYLLAGGGIVNIAGGLGHPVEIMDLSFGVQLGCIHYLLSREKLAPGVYSVPVEIDERVVREQLRADGIKIDG